MIFCSSLYFISKIVFWHATGFGGFLAERIMLSVVLAGYSGVDSSIIYLSCEGTDSQKAFGLYSSMSMAGLLIAAAVFSVFVGDDYWLAGLLTMFSYGLAMVLSFGLTEAFTKRVGIRRSFVLFCVLAIFSCLVLGSTPLALPSVISVLLLRLSNTLFQPFLADLQNRQITSRNRATALSACGMLVDGIAIGTNLVFGALSDWNLSAAFYFGSAICTVGLLLFLLWLKKGYGALSYDTMVS